MVNSRVKPKIIVAGGAGFIGSHLCDFLIKKGEQVVCIDNLITGDKKNIKHLLLNKNFVFKKKDITKPLKISWPIKQIYHFASPASPIDYQQKPIQTLLAGSIGTKNLLDLAKQKKATFLFASTSEVYGDPLQHPQKEKYWGNVNPIGPRSCYDESKRFGESLCYAYKKVNNIEVRIARIFNTYGPRMRKNDGRVIPNFITQALSKKPITIYGNGTQTRSFCYISDLVEGLYLLMNSKETTPTNLGNPIETKIIDLAKKIITITNSTSKIVYKKLPIDDPTRRLPDITKAKQKLNWQPKTSLEEGLKKTIDWFKKS